MRARRAVSMNKNIEWPSEPFKFFTSHKAYTIYWPK